MWWTENLVKHWKISKCYESDCAFSLLHRSSSHHSASIKSLCFISTIPVHFIHSAIKFQSIILFSFPSFLISIQFCSPLKKCPLVVRRPGVTLNDTNLSFGSVLTSVIHSRHGWSRTSDAFAWLSPGEKKMDPTNYFLYVFDGVFDRGWYEFQLKYWCLCFLSAKLKCQYCFKGSLMSPTLSFIMQ